MVEYRRIAVLTVGVWLGAAILLDVAVTQNFQTVDRFLANPGTPAASREVEELGRTRVRALLRRNAAEENNFLFENVERAQLALGVILAGLLGFERSTGKIVLGMALAMLVIVAAQHFYLSPQVADLGRRLDSLAPDDPLTRRFWTLHGIYSGGEILKLLAACALAFRLSIRATPKAGYTLA